MSKSIQFLVLDVDGVLTDGRLVLADDGSLVKAFHVLDGGAIRLWRESGREVALLTARQSPAVSERARELGIGHVLQGFDDKLSGYERLCGELCALDDTVCYVGDDLLDLRPMARCGYPVAVANAAAEVKRIASFVTRRPGGAGAVRDVVQHLLGRAGEWNQLVDKYCLAPVSGKG